MLRLLLVLSVFFLWASPGLAQKAAELDKAHSSIEFATEHIVVPITGEEDAADYYTVGTTNGRFQRFDIKFIPGEEDFTDSRINATIQVASIDTDNGPRDEHLRSKAFFDASVYPMITFNSTKIEKNDQGQYQITGLMMMKGVSREVVFTVEPGKPFTRDDGKLYSSFKAQAQVNRLDFNLKWNELLENGAFRVSNYVKLTIQANFLMKKDS